jgi:sulfur carrier protein
MRILLNGEPRDLPAEATLVEAVEAATAPTQPAPPVETSRNGLAVAVDGEVVPRGEWDRTRLREGQRVEVLHAVQGGA